MFGQETRTTNEIWGQCKRMSDHHDPAERADLTPKTIPLTRSRPPRSEDMDHLSDEALAGIRADVAKRLSAREAAAHFRAVSDVANEQSSRREAARSAPAASITQPKSRPLVRPEIPRIDQHLSQLSLGHHMLQPHRELSVQVRSTAMTTHAPVSETLPETSAGHGDALTMRLPSAWYEIGRAHV